MPGFIGFPEILLLGLVVLLIFGPKRLPEMGRSMGKGLREFKNSVSGDHNDEHEHVVAAIDLPDPAVAESRPLVSVARDHDAA
jgi:sec-independent protein translocase protein TatA